MVGWRDGELALINVDTDEPRLFHQKKKEYFTFQEWAPNAASAKYDGHMKMST